MLFQRELIDMTSIQYSCIVLNFIYRKYYHEKFASDFDIDLFIYSLNENQAIEKIVNIEACIRNNILEKITVSIMLASML